MKHLLLLILTLGCLSVYAQANDSARFYYQKGLAEKESKRWLMASKAFDKAVSFKADYLDAYIENARVSVEMRKVHQAMELYKKIHEMDPFNKEAIKALMEMNYNYRNFKEAIRLAGLCKDCPDADRIIGMSYYKMEDHLNADKFLQKAVKQNDNDAEAYYTIGRNYLDMEEYNKAIPYYEKAVIIDPTKSRWMYEMGLICYNQGKYKEAVQAFDRAISAGYTQNADFRENLGFAAIYAGYYERGEALLLELQKQKTGNTEITRSLAEIYYQQKQFDKSLNMCQLLLEKNPNDGKAMYQAGLNFIKKGDKNRGQQLCDKAIEMDPSLASLRTKKEMLGL
jgi:tetratricopeptide (TPR) repeat protein